MEGKAKWRKLKHVGPTSPGSQHTPSGKPLVKKEKPKTRDAKRRKVGEGDDEEVKINGEDTRLMKKEAEMGVGGEAIPLGMGSDYGHNEANGNEGQTAPQVLVTDLDKDLTAVRGLHEPQAFEEETGVACQTQTPESSATSSTASDIKPHRKSSKSGDSSGNDKPKFFISDEESDSDTAIFVDANQPTPNGDQHIMDHMADGGRDPEIEISAVTDTRGEPLVELTLDSEHMGPPTTQLVDVECTGEPQQTVYKSSIRQPGKIETRKVTIKSKPETVSKSSTSESLIDSASKSSISDLIDQESYSRTTTTETSRTTSTMESQDADTVSISSTTESTEHETLSKLSTTETGDQETITISTTDSTECTSKTSTGESVDSISKSSTVGSMEGESRSYSTESGDGSRTTSGSLSRTTTSEYEEADYRTTTTETTSRTSATSRSTTETGEPTGTSRTGSETITSASETGEYASKSISSSTDYDAESLSSTADLLTPKEEPPFPLDVKAEAEPGEQAKIESSPEVPMYMPMDNTKDEVPEVLPGSPSWEKLDVEDQLRLAGKTEMPEGMTVDAMKDKKDADGESLFFSLYPEYQPGSQEAKDALSAGNPKVLCFRGQTPDQGESHEEIYPSKEKEAGGRIKGAVSGKIQQLQRKLSQQKKPERENKEILESEGSPPQFRGAADIDQSSIGLDEHQVTTPGNGDEPTGEFDGKELPDYTTPGGPLPDVLDRSTAIGTGFDTKEIQQPTNGAKDDLVRAVGKLGERIEGLADSVEVVAGVVSDIVQNASGQAPTMAETGQEALEGEGKVENNMKDRKTLVGKARDWIKGVARIGSKKEDTADKAAEKEREAAKLDLKKSETPSENGTDDTSSGKSKEGAEAEGQKMPGTPPKEDTILQISKEERISLSGENGLLGIEPTPEEGAEGANHYSDKGSLNGNGKRDEFADEEKPASEEAAQAVVTLEEELMKAEDQIMQEALSGYRGTGEISPIKEAGTPEKETIETIHIHTLGAEEEKPDSAPRDEETKQAESKEETTGAEGKEETAEEPGKETQETAEGSQQAEVVDIVTEAEAQKDEIGVDEGAAEEPGKSKDELKPRRKRREKSKSPSTRKDKERKERKDKDKDKDKDGKGSLRRRRHRHRSKSQEERGEPGVLQATEVIDTEAIQVEPGKDVEAAQEPTVSQEADVSQEPEKKQDIGFVPDAEKPDAGKEAEEPDAAKEAETKLESPQEPSISSQAEQKPQSPEEQKNGREDEAEAQKKQEDITVTQEQEVAKEAEEKPDAAKGTEEQIKEVENGKETEAKGQLADSPEKLEITEETQPAQTEGINGQFEQGPNGETKKEESPEKTVDKAEIGTAKKVDTSKEDIDEKKEKDADQQAAADETPRTRRRKDSGRSYKDKFSDEFWKDKLSSGVKKPSFGSGDYSGIDFKRPTKLKRDKSEESKEEKQDTEESEKTASKSEEKPQDEVTQPPQETQESGDPEEAETQASATGTGESWSPRVGRKEKKSSRRSGEHKRESRSSSKSKSKEKKHPEAEGSSHKSSEDVGSPKSLKKKKKKSEGDSTPEPKPRTRHSKPDSPLTKKTPTSDQQAADSAPVLQELKFPEGISKPVSPSPFVQTLKFPEGISQPLSPTPEKVKPIAIIPKPTHGTETQPLSPLRPLKFPEGISQPISPITQKVKPPPFKPTQETAKEEVAQTVSPTSKTVKSPDVLSPSPKELKFPEGVSVPRSPTPQELKFPEGISKPLSPSPMELKFPVGVSKPLSPSPKELKFPEGISKPLSPAPRELKFPEGIAKPLSPAPKEAKLAETQLSPSPKELTFPEGISKPLSPSPKENAQPFSPPPQELKFPEGITKPLSPAIIAGKMPEPKPLKERKKERPRVIIPKTLEPAIEPMKPISPMKTLKFPEGVTKPISPMKTKVISVLKPSSPTSETKKPMSPLKPLKFPEGISKPISPLPPKAQQTVFKPAPPLAKPPSPTLEEAKPITTLDKATATDFPPKSKASHSITKLEFPAGVSMPASPTPAKTKAMAAKAKLDMKPEMQVPKTDAEVSKIETEASSPMITALQFPEGISKPLSPVPPGPKPTDKKVSTPDEPPTPPLPSTMPPELPKLPVDGTKPVFIPTTATDTSPVKSLTFPEGVSVPISPLPKTVKPTTSSPLIKPSSPLHKVTSPQPKVSSITSPSTQKPTESPKPSEKSELLKSILSTKKRPESVKSPEASTKPVTEGVSDQTSAESQAPPSKASPEEKPLTTGERISRAVASIGLTRSSEGRTSSKFSRSDSLRSSQKRAESQEGAPQPHDDSHAKDGTEAHHTGAESPSKRLRRRKKR